MLSAPEHSADRNIRRRIVPLLTIPMFTSCIVETTLAASAGCMNSTNVLATHCWGSMGFDCVINAALQGRGSAVYERVPRAGPLDKHAASPAAPARRSRIRRRNPSRDRWGFNLAPSQFVMAVRAVIAARTAMEVIVAMTTDAGRRRAGVVQDMVVRIVAIGAGHLRMLAAQRIARHR